MKVDYSIVIPSFNESKNIINIFNEIKLSLKGNYEIIYVDDGSNDNSTYYYDKLKNEPNVVIIKNSNNLGQSKSLENGIKISKSDTIVTIDGDCQNDPKDIMKLLEIYKKDNIALVGGIRAKRKDTIVKKISSIIANKVRSYILNDNCPDTGCGLKIFSKQVFQMLPYFNGIHRFLPALFIGFGYNTSFVFVNHRKREIGKSNYGVLNRLFKGIIDIYRVKIIINKSKKND
tara:strand:- start:225 stop:917 length:693 start_codon:yes stop_codon:yes gene_type:complete